MRCFLLGALMLLFLVASGHAAVTTEWAVGTTTTLLSTELNSLASNGFTTASTVYDNRIGQTGNGFALCRFELVATFAANPTANTAVSVWFLKNTDTTTPTYENTPTGSISLGRAPDVVLPVTTGQTGTRVALDVICPAERFKIVAKNDGTGQSMAASGNTIRILPISPQGN